MSESFAGRVWNTLSKVDCSAHIEKKAGLSYLSWAWAWGILMEHFPESEFDFMEEEVRHDGTTQIWVKVTVRDGDKTLARCMWLPVMDHRNKPIQHPDAFQINSSRMRCLTKCLAMFGLGHYIYAGEDLPTESPASDVLIVSEEQSATLKSLIEATQTDVKKFLLAVCKDAQSVDALPKRVYATAHAMLLKKQERMNQDAA